MPLRLRIRLSIIQGTRKGISFSRVRDFSELNDIKNHLNVIFEYSRKGIVQSHIVFNELYAAERPANEFSVIMISSSPQNNGRQNPAPLENAVWIFNNEEQLDLVDSQRPISLLDSQMDKIHEVNEFMQRKLCLMNNHEPGFEEFFIPVLSSRCYMNMEMDGYLERLHFDAGSMVRDGNSCTIKMCKDREILSFCDKNCHNSCGPTGVFDVVTCTWNCDSVCKPLY